MAEPTMSDKALIDLIGGEAVKLHFQLTPQSLYNWRTRGIPLTKRIPFMRFAAERGIVPPPHFLEKLAA